MTTDHQQTRFAIALLKAQQEIHGVGKDAKNNFQNYDYVSAEAIVAVSRLALNAHGLTVEREFTIDEAQAVPPMLPILKSTFHVSHAESGGSRVRSTDWFICEGKGRPIDKALAGALTSSLAYFLRDLLQIPKQEEAESLDRRDDRDAPSRKQSQPVAPKRTESQTATLGFTGALALRKKLTGANLELATLVLAMQSKGLDVPEDIAEFPSGWLPRINNWIDSATSKDSQ